MNRAGRLVDSGRYEGEDAPMRQPIHPPTRAAYNQIDLVLMHHVGLLGAISKRVMEIDPSDVTDQGQVVFD